MNWSRIKSILIGVFIVVNVYLLIQYFAVNESTDVLSHTTIENTIQLLEGKGITVKANSIPRRIERDKKTNIPYKTGADALITFADLAQKKGITPCKVEELALDDGVWIITTDKGEYYLNANTLKTRD